MDFCTILIDDWQMQCCGEPFSVGDTVSWLAARWDGEPLTYMDAGKIDYYYEHHSEDYKKLFKVTGKVAKIQALYCTLAPDPADPSGVTKIKIQGTAFPVLNMADGYEEDIDGQEFDAYLVRLEDIKIMPAKQSEVTFH
jgi:hypothetical protein